MCGHQRGVKTCSLQPGQYAAVQHSETQLEHTVSHRVGVRRYAWHPVHSKYLIAPLHSVSVLGHVSNRGINLLKFNKEHFVYGVVL